MLELYAMKVARTVLRGCHSCKTWRSLNRPYAALMKLVITFIYNSLMLIVNMGRR